MIKPCLKLEKSRKRVDTGVIVSLFNFCLIEVIILALLFGEKLAIVDYITTLAILFGGAAFLSVRVVSDMKGRKQSFYMESFSSAMAGARSLHDVDTILLNEIRRLLPGHEVAIAELNLTSNQVRIRAGVNHDEALSEWLAVEVQTDEFIDLKQRSLYKVYSSPVRSIFLIINKQKKASYTARIVQEQIKTMRSLISLVYEKQFLVDGLTGEIEHILSKNPDASPKMIRLIFEISEQERRKLSLDIHDTALQEQLLWHRRLQELLYDNKLDDSVQASLSEVAEGMLDVIYRLREICADLRPQLIWERGIKGALNDLFKKVQLRSDFFIEFDSSQFVDHLNQEEILTLYRIVQELLNNTYKHAKASKVNIILYSKAGKVMLKYQDDGIGFEPLSGSDKNLGIGLAGIQERVRGLAGKSDFWSKPNQGVRFEMCFVPNALETPLDEGGA